MEAENANDAKWDLEECHITYEAPEASKSRFCSESAIATSSTSSPELTATDFLAKQTKDLLCRLLASTAGNQVSTAPTTETESSSDLSRWTKVYKKWSYSHNRRTSYTRIITSKWLDIQKNGACMKPCDARYTDLTWLWTCKHLCGWPRMCMQLSE